MATATVTRLSSENIKPLIGSRVLNSRAELLSGDIGGEIRALLEARGVLVLPGIDFADEEQVAFTRTLGTFARERHGQDIHKITLDTSQNSSADYLKGAFFWHFDGFSSPKPVFASLLAAKVLAPQGGDTDFANTYAAYEALDEADKEMLEELEAIHDFAATQLDVDPQPSYETWRKWRAIGGKTLPLVWTHRNGRKSLVIGNSAHHVVGMDPLESKDLLIRLRDFATGDRFTYRHRWSPGDLVMWDNTGTLHRATPYDPASGRMLHRTKLAGEEPIAR